MNKWLMLGFGCLSCLLLRSQVISKIIPEPVSIQEHKGKFILPALAVIDADTSGENKWAVIYLANRMKTAGIQIQLRRNFRNPAIQIAVNRKYDSSIRKEGYRLWVKPNGVILNANTPQGLFYGVQTLLQLFPKEIESPQKITPANWRLSLVSIVDYPRFQWRGLMLDVVRHFFSVADVKQYINQMCRYKFNLLHLHLSDNQGWRIQINSLPQLTETGAWRNGGAGRYSTLSHPVAGERGDYGGFYTHQDIKELVQYARERFVDLLPEIDMPGHSLAAIASYPYLACSASGGKTPIASDNNLCPANEKVYEFADKVVTEIASLFPFEYIHIGGDETSKTVWQQDEGIKTLMRRENLQTMEQVQGYFTSRVEKIVLEKGKKLIGWDEIVEGGLSPTAAVMSWRGIKGGIEAAKLGHQVVMSPTSDAYFDYMQGDAAIEPSVGPVLQLHNVYQFEPVPEGVDPQFIKGGQANLWTEQVYNIRHAQYMTWPRGWALAEVLWSPKDKRNWLHFSGKLQWHFQRQDIAGVKYATSVYEPLVHIDMDTTSQMLKMELTAEMADVEMYYSVDESYPDRFYPKYSSPVVLPQDLHTLRIVSYIGDQPVGRILSISVDELRKRALRSP
jgi:hexosaminidase